MRRGLGPLHPTGSRRTPRSPSASGGCAAVLRPFGARNGFPCVKGPRAVDAPTAWEDWVSQELYSGSPVAPLAAALDARLTAGAVGIVVAPPGIGKSTMLVHLALRAMLVGDGVLHVALRDTVEHARAHYDEVFRAVFARTRMLLDGRDGVEAQVVAERHRMIHSFAGRPFDADQVRRHLELLGEAAQFRPKLLLLDGFELEGLERHFTAVAELARHAGAMAWVSVRADGPLPPSLAQRAGAVLRLASHGPVVHLTLEGTDHRLALDPSALLESSDEGVDPFAPETLEASACTLYSGGAKGTEAAFGEASARWGVTEVAFTFDGHIQDRTEGRYVLSPAELAAGDVSLQYVSKRLHRTYNDQGGLIRGVLQTLWHMVSRSQQVFVVGSIQEDGTVRGGTGWSVELGRTWSRDLWVYDQDQGQWFHWQGKRWQPGLPVIRSVHFTGTGTRKLTAAGLEAIDDLFERSFAL